MGPYLSVVILCVFCGILLTACTVLSVRELQDVSTTKEMYDRIEKLVDLKQWEEAAELISDCDTNADPRADNFRKLIAEGCLEVAGTYERTFRYGAAMAAYEKVASLDGNEPVEERVRELKKALAVPKVFVNAVPFDVLLYRDGEPWEKSFSPQVIGQYPEAGDGFVPGSVIRIKVVSSFDFKSMSVAVMTMKGTRLAAASGFKLREDNGFFEWFCFQGLSCVMKNTTYKVSFNAEGLDGLALSFNEEILVIAREFPKETIKLSDSLTSLISKPDKRKDEERKRVREILKSFDPRAVYSPVCFGYPLEDRNAIVSSYFGHRRIFLYSSGRKTTSVHDGIDLAVPKGTPVLSMARGRVALAREHMVSGNTVVLEHLPGIYSVYYHMSRIDVEEGVMVAQGQQIGAVGTTGFSTAPHLHFSVFAGTLAVDPMYFIENKPFY